MAHVEQRAFCEKVKTRFPDAFHGKRVLDVGSLDINGNNKYLFDDCEYTGLDLGHGKNVDIVCPVHEHSGLYDTIISTEVFEHDPHIKESLDNIVSNLLKPGGLFVFTCADEGRHEHGTTLCMPGESPFTNNHYKNLSEETIKELIDIDHFFGENFRFSRNLKTKDLYFVGRKAGGPAINSPFWPRPKVSIIIPVVRPEGAARCAMAIRNVEAAEGLGQSQILTVEDTDGIGCPEMVKRLTRMAKHDLVMFLGDDTIPQSGFLKAALDEMENLPDGWGVVGLNTEDPSGSNPYAHWMAHKKMLEHIPGGSFFPTDYKHCFCDAELKDIAHELGRWSFAKKSMIEHDHPVNKRNMDDKDYERAYGNGRWAQDHKTYIIRKRERMAAKHGTRLALAFPLTDIWTYSQFTFSILSVVMNHLTLSIKNNESMHLTILMPNFPGQVDVIRNDLVKQAQLDGCTDILMMDTDQMYPDADMIQKLLAHKLPVVGAKVHRRYPPFDPILLRGKLGELKPIPDDEIVGGGLVKVDAIGCGCVMFDMAVFDEIENPWFELTTGPAGVPIGEDVGFCMKLKERGIDIIVDCSIDVKHLALMAVDWGTHKLHQKLQGG